LKSGRFEIEPDRKAEPAKGAGKNNYYEVGTVDAGNESGELFARTVR
jgi:hypothetical protein